MGVQEGSEGGMGVQEGSGVSGDRRQWGWGFKKAVV